MPVFRCTVDCVLGRAMLDVGFGLGKVARTLGTSRWYAVWSRKALKNLPVLAIIDVDSMGRRSRLLAILKQCQRSVFVQLMAPVVRIITIAIPRLHGCAPIETIRRPLSDF